MDEKAKEILERCCSKRLRAQLIQNSELILGLHGRGYTLKEIAGILLEECQISVSLSRLSRFIAGRKKATPEQRRIAPQDKMLRGGTTHLAVPARPIPTKNPDYNEARRIIEALKQHTHMQNESTKKPYQFDGTQPLTLNHEKQEGLD